MKGGHGRNHKSILKLSLQENSHFPTSYQNNSLHLCTFYILFHERTVLLCFANTPALRWTLDLPHLCLPRHLSHIQSLTRVHTGSRSHGDHSDESHQDIPGESTDIEGGYRTILQCTRMSCIQWEHYGMSRVRLGRIINITAMSHSWTMTPR